MIKIKIVQKTKYTWKLVSPTGHIIQDNVSLHDEYRVIEYIKTYISSYDNWTYEVVWLETV